MNNQIIVFIAFLLITLLVLALSHWLILRKRCSYKYMVNSQKLIPVKKNDLIWYIKFSPGKILGIFPCWVYWQKYYLSGESTYKVSGSENWVKGKIKEVKIIQNKLNI